LHLVFHSLVKAGLFYQIGQVHQFYKSYWIKDVVGYFKRNPVGGLVMVLGVISILAIPPSGLFISEFLTFKAMFLAQHYYIGILVLALLTIIIYSFSKNTFHLLYDDEKIVLYSGNSRGVNLSPVSVVTMFDIFTLAEIGDEKKSLTTPVV